MVDVYDVPGAGFVSGIANGFDSLWVAGASLYQLNINTGKIVSKIDTGAAPENVIVASDFLWVTNSDGDLLKINPSDNSTVETKDLYPSRAGELAVGGSGLGGRGELTNTVTRLPLPPRPFFPPAMSSSSCWRAIDPPRMNAPSKAASRTSPLARMGMKLRSTSRFLERTSVYRWSFRLRLASVVW